MLQLNQIKNSKYLSTVSAATVRKIAPTVALQKVAWDQNIGNLISDKI